jgi:hypothetical protein
MSIVHNGVMGDVYEGDDDEGEVAVPLDDALVAAFWSYARLAHSPDRADRLAAEEFYWASLAVDRAISDRVDGVVALIVSLADAAAGNLEDLAYLGAGPVEELLRFGDTPPTASLLDDLDAAARRNENVRLAVRAVWWGPKDDPQTVARFERFGPSY